jgi:dienelactone hydrolase
MRFFFLPVLTELANCSSMLQPPGKELKLRRMDAQFVLDQLEALARGDANADLEQRALPPGLRASLDLNRIGIFGHSLGGAVAANAMANDRRFDAGLNLDGGGYSKIAIRCRRLDCHPNSSGLSRNRCSPPSPLWQLG